MASASRRVDQVAVTSDGVTVGRSLVCVEAASVGLLVLVKTFPHTFGTTCSAVWVAARLDDVVLRAQ